MEKTEVLTPPFVGVVATFLEQAITRTPRRLVRIGTAGLSPKRFYRLDPPVGLVLLDARERPELVDRLVSVSSSLRQTSLGCPRIDAFDAGQGLALVQDVGDMTLADAMRTGAGGGDLLIAAATALRSLWDLDATADVARPKTSREAAAELEPLAQWVLPHTVGDESASIFEELVMCWRRAYAGLPSAADCLTLGDVSPDNIQIVQRDDAQFDLWFLDYDDACLYRREFDLVSLLQNVRRPLDRTSYFSLAMELSKVTNQPWDEASIAYHVLGLQRAVRIFGLFARLVLRDDKRYYERFLPFTCDYIYLNAKLSGDRELNRIVRACNISSFRPRSA